jgi:NADPH-dependent ferric siderophore reductase
VGPRGKIPLDPIADWHLFVGDVASLGSFYRLASSIEVPGRAIFIVELDNAEDAVTTTLPEGLGVTGVFVDRGDRRGGDPGALLNALAAVATPPDEGHAYLFGEFHCIRAVATALSEWGLSDEQISLKAFWRAGRDNGDNGEPPKEVA